MSERNPFEVLQLDPSASEEEIVRQAGRLRQRTADEAGVSAIRQAVQALTSSADQRTLHATLTFPGVQHEWPALERLKQTFRRPLAIPEEAPPPCPPLDRAAVAEFLWPLLVKELDMPPQPLPLPPLTDTPEEIGRQTIEGLWQLLLANPEAVGVAKE